jgi:hypothetical protein
LIALVVLAIPINTTIADDSVKTYDLQQAYYNQQAEYQWSSQLVTYSKTLVGKRTGQCVTSLRQYFGVPRSAVQGLAKNTKINSQTGKVGAIVVFKNMSWAGHVGYQITPTDSQGNFQYFDSNGGWSLRGAVRTININDRRISGYRIYR